MTEANILLGIHHRLTTITALGKIPCGEFP